MTRRKRRFPGQSYCIRSSATGVLMTHHLRYVLTCVVVLLARPTLAQQPEPALAERYASSEVMIPMRDGVKLHTVIHAPKSSKEPLPFILSRTPYDNGGNPAA